MSTPISFRKPTLDGLIEDDNCDNHWVRYKCLEIYLRKGMHFVIENDEVFKKPCLMVANLSALPCRHAASSSRVLPRLQRHGLQIVSFMKEVERRVIEGGYDGVFVENVYKERQREMLLNHDYKRVGSADTRAPSFYKSAATIRRCSDWVHQGLQSIHEEGRASLRGFCQTPSTRRFWIRDRATGLAMFVKREWVGTSPLEQRQRFYILKLHRYKEKDGIQVDTHWLHDIQDMVKRVEHALRRHSFSEIAIDPFAIDCYRMGISTESWGQSLGYSLNDSEPGFRHRFLVKALSSESLRPRPT